MNKTANCVAMCKVLMERARIDSHVTVLCSDSRGSASLVPFPDSFPKQFVEVGIAEQNLVSIAAGMASCGRKCIAVSPASFISTRSYEQAKVDCAYSRTDVKLVGISGGVSYGALGMTHHSAQDIAAFSAIPGMRVYLPSDRFQTEKLFNALLDDDETAYIRLGRNPVEDIYSEEDCPFVMDKATVIKEGEDVTFIACGEMVRPALDASRLLEAKDISAGVIDMYCVKPIDREAVIRAAENSSLIITIEEHSPYGGLGSMVSQIVSSTSPVKVINLSLPDEPVITGTSTEVFHYYGLDASHIALTAEKELKSL